MAGRRLTGGQQARIRQSQQRRCQRAAQTATLPDMESGLGVEQTGLAITVHGQALIVEDELGTLRRCTVRQNLGRLACGDRVIWQASPVGDGVVTAIAERRSLFTRPDYRGELRPVAANLDAVGVVIAPFPEPSELLIDSYLTAIAAFGIQGLLIFNKVDLLDSAQRSALLERLVLYQQAGYQLLTASSYSAHGLQELRAWLRGRVSLFVGQSGVGKSSLVQALLPDREIRIQALSTVTGHGVHTTSASTLYHLPDGGDLIDSPGVRSFDLSLSMLRPHDLAKGFPELLTYLGRCRFSDCRHESEPDCALLAAVECGAVAAQRLQSYRQLRTNMEAATQPGRSKLFKPGQLSQATTAFPPEYP